MLCSPRVAQFVAECAVVPGRQHHSCLNSGKNLLFVPESLSLGDVHDERDLVGHLVATTGLSESEAARVVEDVIAYLAEPVEDYVRRRHAELKTYGAKNPQIFAEIATELAERVVAAPELTERQLRRIVYG
jgi:hypothetical protein